LSAEYQIPKRKVRATVCIPGEADRATWLYLGETAECHFGPERPSDLLNGSSPFIPATDDDGTFTLLQRDAISACTIAVEAEAGATPNAAGAESAISHTIRVRLSGGRELAGELTFVRPEGQQRLQDGLNGSEPFFAVWDGDHVHLINRRHVIWIAQD
jgi:hypothetical protein